LLIVHLKNILAQGLAVQLKLKALLVIDIPERLKISRLQVPTVGLFPFSEAEVGHTVCPAPRFRNVMVPEC